MSDKDTNEDKVEALVREPLTPMPVVNALTFDDLRACLSNGISDFRKATMFGLFFGGVFALGGIFIIQSLLVWKKIWMIYPVMISFPLIGPFAAVGLYEVSRRLQTGNR